MTLPPPWPPHQHQQQQSKPAVSAADARAADNDRLPLSHKQHPSGSPPPAGLSPVSSLSSAPPSTSPAAAEASDGLLGALHWLLISLSGGGTATASDQILAMAALALALALACAFTQAIRGLKRGGDSFHNSVGRSSSSMQLLRRGESSGSGLTASEEAGRLVEKATIALLSEEEEQEQAKTEAEVEASEHDFDAHRIYGSELAGESGPEPRYDLPDDLVGDIDDDVAPDDSVSVAWYKTAAQSGQYSQALPPLQEGGSDSCDAAVSAPKPVTVEAPDGTRHAMDVELDGLQSMRELRRGMLQGYRELLGVQLPAHALQVHVRLETGRSILLTDDSPLSEPVLRAVSFYVWGDCAALPLGDEDAPSDAGSKWY